MTLAYKPRAQFIPFHNRKQRWATLNTHRRAGKTVALVNDIIFGALECRQYKPQLAYVGPTYSQAKRIAWTYIKDFAEPYFLKPPQEAELKVTLKNDATIYVLGADNADSLRGMYLDGFVGDEYAMFRPSVFSQVIRPALSDRHGWGVFASTPRGKNLFYDQVRLAEKTPSDWYNLTLKASTSGIIHPQELLELQRDMDPEEFAQEYECSFDAALKGAIYANEVNTMFLEGRIIQEDLYDPNLPVHVVFDLGFTDATVAIWFQVTKRGQVNIVSAEATTGQDIFYHIEKIQAFRGDIGDVWLPHDARAKNLQTGKSIVEQFLKEGIRPQLVPAHKVRDGISAARKVFPSVFIQEDTTGDLVEALKAYRRQWNDTLLMFSDTPLHDWASDWADSFRYLCMVCGIKDVAVQTTPIGTVNPDLSEYNLETLHEDRLMFLTERRIA
jgi:phage terminase large subunit